MHVCSTVSFLTFCFSLCRIPLTLIKCPFLPKAHRARNLLSLIPFHEAVYSYEIFVSHLLHFLLEGSLAHVEYEIPF